MSLLPPPKENHKNHGNRQLNIELLRVIAMLMVVIQHINFQALIPDTPGGSISLDLFCTVTPRLLIATTCVTAVNIFVMISGWFGIRPSVRGFLKFMWQVTYIVGISLAVSHFCFHNPITLKDVLMLVGLFRGGGWFVASYMALYIMSPILNMYLKHCDPRKAIILALLFFTFEVLWSNSGSVSFIVGGYSAFSFIGIYVLAGALRKMQLNYTARKAFSVFMICAIANTAVYLLSMQLDSVALRDMILNYINPLTIAAAAAMVLTFNKIDIKDTVVNRKVITWMASSCFAIYLVHVGTPFTWWLFIETARDIAAQFKGAALFGMLALYTAAIFLAGIIIDKPRLWLWRVFNRYFSTTRVRTPEES